MNPRDLSAALSLVQAAVGDHLDVDLSYATDRPPMLELTEPDSRNYRLKIYGQSGLTRSEAERDAIWVFRRLSGAKRNELRVNNVNFIGLNGSVRIELPGLFIDRSDLQPVLRLRDDETLIDPFADRSSRILRTLLAFSKHREWGVRELATAADVDPATASRATRELARRELVDWERVGRGSKIILTDPMALLRRWTELYDWRMNKSVHVHAPIGDEDLFLKRLGKSLRGHRWALTMMMGAFLRAPHATQGRIHVYVDAEDVGALHQVIRRANWHAADEGRLVLLIPYYRDSVWLGLSHADGMKVVSDVQLVLDLWHYPLRGREQAQHLIDTKLARVWKDG